MNDKLPLAGFNFVEHVEPRSSEVTLRAIALAGRIAADLGATVSRWTAGADPLAACAVDHRFLNGGKLTGEVDTAGTRAVLADASSALPLWLDATPVKVLVSPGVPAEMGIAESSVTDTTILALSGLLDLMGDPAEAPVPLGGHQASGVAGLAAFSGLMAALAAGRPETVRVSALEACLWSNWKSYAERLYMGRTPTRQGKLAEWQALPCRDGYATLIFLEKDWPAVCRMIGDPRLSMPPLDTQAGRRADMGAVYAIARPWFASRTKAEIYKAARAEGLPMAPVLTVRDVLDDSQFAAQRFFAPIDPGAGAGAPLAPTIPTVWNGQRFVRRTPEKPAVTARGSKQLADAAPGAAPLAGCRVLDLGIITAGASTSAILADLGAEVIKIEASAYIDPFRTWDRGLGAPDWWNRSRFFEFTNRNKRGLALDLKQPEGKKLFLDLVAKSDVVVENFRRGVLERLGLGWDVLSAANPRLVMCSITSQGETGPDAGAATYGSTLEANSGLSDLTRDAHGAPLISGILLNYPDQIVSIYAAGIATLAVMEQRRTGKGAHLDVSQRELASFLIGEHVLAASEGSSAGIQAPPVAILRDARSRWIVRHKDGSSVPVRNGNDLLEAVEHGEIRSAFAKAPDGTDAKGIPFWLDGMPLAIARRAPQLGQHNTEVLREILGLDAGTVAVLAAKGIIGTTPKP
ncbi:MAG TPA: CoA transferase [Hyphomicrobiaceae bacterium]|nr:CoA transferase [Hyphomicrobiaceae bacterium]